MSQIQVIFHLKVLLQKLPFSTEHPSKRLAGKVFHTSSTDALKKENVDKEVSETLKKYLCQSIK